MRARVTSIRHVAWDETQNGGFFFVLRPGPAVSRLPHAFVGFVRTGEDATRRASLQRALVEGFPNVTAIDVRAVVASIRDVLDNVTLGITVVGVVTLVSGVLILIGAVAMTKFQRLYDAAIYRTLGASTRLIATMVAVEYGLLGAWPDCSAPLAPSRCRGRLRGICSKSPGGRRRGCWPPERF